MPFIALALILAAAIGGGLSVIAQHALPGDPLWGFKVQVNERIQETFAPGAEARANFDLSAIELRANEAGRLVIESKLSTDLQEQIRAQIAEHVQSVKSQVETLQASGEYAKAADIALQLQATLAKYSSGTLDLRTLLDQASQLSADASAQVPQP